MLSDSFTFTENLCLPNVNPNSNNSFSFYCFSVNLGGFTLVKLPLKSFNFHLRSYMFSLNYLFFLYPFFILYIAFSYPFMLFSWTDELVSLLVAVDVITGLKVHLLISFSYLSWSSSIFCSCLSLYLSHLYNLDIKSL